jgi:hypothetical protein
MITRGRFYLVFLLVLISSVASAQERSKAGKAIQDAVPCNEFALPVKQAVGQPVGVEQCHIISEETVFNVKGHHFRRVEVRLTAVKLIKQGLLPA